MILPYIYSIGQYFHTRHDFDDRLERYRLGLLIFFATHDFIDDQVNQNSTIFHKVIYNLVARMAPTLYIVYLLIAWAEHSQHFGDTIESRDRGGRAILIGF